METEELVWKYEVRKAKAFLRDNPEVWTLLRLCREYRRGLVEIARQRKQRYDDLRREVAPEIVNYETRERELVEQLKVAHSGLSGVRHKDRVGSAESLVIKAIKIELQALRQPLKEAKAAVNDVLRPWNEERDRRLKELKEEIPKAASRRRAEVNDEVDTAMMADAAVPELWKRSRANDIESHRRELELAAEMAKRGLPDQHRELVLKSVADALAKLKGRPITHSHEEGGVLGYRRRSAGGDVGITVKELTSGKDPWVTLGALEESQWQDTDQHSARQGKKFARPGFTLRLRAKPEIRATGVLAMHRPLPKDAIIKSVKLAVKRLGNKWRCSLQFQLSTSVRSTRPVGVGSVAVNVGWRIRPGTAEHEGPNRDVERDWGESSTRVLFAVDDQGNEMEYRLPAKLREREKYAATVHAACDRLYNEANAAFRVFRIGVHDALLRRIEVTRWIDGAEQKVSLYEATEAVGQWRAHHKLRRAIGEAVRGSGLVAADELEQLWKAWRSERKAAKLDLFCSHSELSEWLSRRGSYDGTVECLLWFEWWRRKDAHLEHLYRAMRFRNAEKTKHYYREVAAQLAARYETLVLGKQEFAKQKRKKEVENDNSTEQERAARANMHKASPGLCHATLKERFKGRVRVVEMENATIVHHGCGCQLIGDRKADLFLVCEKTGESVDQDANAARNILAGGAMQDASGSALQAAE